MMWTDWIPIIVAVVMSGPGIYATLKQSKKDKKDSEDKRTSTLVNGAEQVTGTALQLVEYLNRKLVELQIEFERELVERDEYINYLLEGIEILTRQIICAGGDPEFKPNPKPK